MSWFASGMIGMIGTFGLVLALNDCNASYACDEVCGSSKEQATHTFDHRQGVCVCTDGRVFRWREGYIDAVKASKAP